MKSLQTESIKRLVLGLLVALVGVMLTACLFNRSPEAAFALVEGVPYGAAPQTFVFDISVSSDPDGEIVSFTFDFGDGSAQREGNDLSEPISHLYEEAGVYIITLTVTDNDGKTDELKIGLVLTPPPDE
jgi:PKD repeat protein